MAGAPGARGAPAARASRHRARVLAWPLAERDSEVPRPAARNREDEDPERARAARGCPRRRTGMSEHRPDFDTLVPDDLGSSERDRLLRVHDALLAAGPPPDLSARLAGAPATEERVVELAPRRRRRQRFALVAIAAALAVAVFAAGFSAGDHRGTPSAVATVSMTGTPLAENAHASLALFEVDTAGNWPMKLSVKGL